MVGNWHGRLPGKMSNKLLLKVHLAVSLFRSERQRRTCNKITRPRGCSSGYVIIVCNKMVWNGKHPLESASTLLLENFELFAYACL